MIGTWLAETLRARGDQVTILTRRRPKTPEHVQWDPNKGVVDIGRLEGLDALVNLAGEPLATRPWTRVRRRKLWESRVDATGTLLRSLDRLDNPPPTYVGVGGLGYYGDRGEQLLTEDDGPGEGFLAELAAAWETAHLESVAILDTRAAVLRLAIVLSPTGGAFPLLVRPFRIGVGGWLGHGEQYTPWLTVLDTVGALVHLIDTPSCSGVYNGTVPEPTRNRAWMEALATALSRQVRTHAPRWALRGALGELADSLLIASTRVVPNRLIDSGYAFHHPDPLGAWQWCVGEWDRRNEREG